MHGIKKLLFTSGFIQLLQCCFLQSNHNIYSSIVLIRNGDFYDTSPLGSLIEPDRVITRRLPWMFCGGKDALYVGFNCHIISFGDPSLTNCINVKVKNVIPYHDADNTTADSGADSALCILILENAVDGALAKPTRVKRANDKINRDDCIVAAYVIENMNFESDGIVELTKESRKIIELSKSNFDKKLEHFRHYYAKNFSLKNFNHEYKVTAKDIELQQFSGQLILCTLQANPKQYVQFGIVTKVDYITLTDYEYSSFVYQYVDLEFERIRTNTKKLDAHPIQKKI